MNSLYRQSLWGGVTALLLLLAVTAQAQPKTSGGNVASGGTNISVANPAGTLPVAHGGTGTTSGRNAGANVGVFQMTPTIPVAGAYVDMQNATPSFIGQMGVSMYGNFAPFIWFARSTTQGDWQGPINLLNTVTFGNQTQMAATDTGEYKFYSFGNATLNVTNGTAMAANGPLLLETMSGFGQTAITFGYVTNDGTTTQAYESDVNAANIGIGGNFYPIESARGFFYMNTDPGFSEGFTGPTASVEGNSFYSFKQIFAIDNKGKDLIHFLKDVAQVGSYTNASSLDIMTMHRTTGNIEATNGTVTIKSLQGPNQACSVLYGFNGGQISADTSGNIATGSAGNTSFATYSKFKGAVTGTSYANKVIFDADGAGTGINASAELHSIFGLEGGVKGVPLFAVNLGSENGSFGGFNPGPTYTIGYGCTNTDISEMGTLQVIGSIATFITNITANYTTPTTNSTVLMNGSALTNTIADPTAHAKGRNVLVKNVNNSILTVTNTQGIDLTNAVSLGYNQYVGLQSDGTKWQITSLGMTTTGLGSPNTVITAPIGSVYLRLDGGAATTIYIKESGTGNTGWVAK